MKYWIKNLYEKILKGESVIVSEEDVNRIESYDYSFGGCRLLNIMICERLGNGKFKCYL